MDPLRLRILQCHVTDLPGGGWVNGEEASAVVVPTHTIPLFWMILFVQN